MSSIGVVPYTIIGPSTATGSGSYVLVMKAVHPLHVVVGKLGEYVLKPGCYLYAGSALGGLMPRLARHCRPEKRLHWHVDYLTTQLGVQEAWVVLRNERLECLCAEALRSLPGAEVPIARFGASDCRCATHLVSFVTSPTAQAFEQALMGLLARGG